ncbi:hypothetical protein LSCM1_04563 [Leishmania martiniquensis]|uniref:Uncharacterized protein n=1 Tax=Leishmania martiniquensis TaxID=1580590 RepID=A0A836GU05_9TRYP|nr:hypothetical protein LSCM1_04563 [Leishmania martiniquensis]
MKIITVLKHRVRARLDLARARMQMRNLRDHELIGRYCGLMLFPFAIYVCVGQMHTYSESQIRDRIMKQKGTP